MQSIKVAPSQPSVLKASPSVAGPSDANCLMQIAHIHKLKDSELNYDKHRLDLSMQMLRNREGLNAPLKLGMELHAARQIGRLPFLQSSHLMEDVLLGRDELIEFGDFLGVPENSEVMRQPHAVVEKAMGIL
ncbi:proteasome maturation protein [Episyrphus balteatus]|uniref:proteasome maturation protein n=1 Tax=Episyrphus balteatus TaxID=286459 RepID=UPI0024863EDC|nr:proteasome maturation protein [Episyrphus balteatus]